MRYEESVALIMIGDDEVMTKSMQIRRRSGMRNLSERLASKFIAAKVITITRWGVSLAFLLMDI